MTKHPIFQALGFMSGTSVDAVDMALIETDGYSHVKPLAFESYPYSDIQRETIKAAFGYTNIKDPIVKAAKNVVMLAHLEAFEAFTAKHQCQPDVAGFHGQTIYHNPDKKKTIAIGKGQGFANLINIPVVFDMRKEDVQAGGQGAPLIPLYHKAILGEGKEPTIFVNIGGVANITYINGETVIACDTGPGNALLDDFLLAQTGKAFDENGTLAASGCVHKDLLEDWLDNSYFEKAAPKSLDRNTFETPGLESLSAEDGAATLTMFTVKAIAKVLSQLPEKPSKWLICGGGRYNDTMIKWLSAEVGEKVIPIEEIGYNGDAIEAEGWAYLAVRSKLSLSLSLPSTTGCSEPLTGGTLFEPNERVCVQICAMDENTGWCIGCGRSREEIDNWGTFEDAQRTALEKALPERVQQLKKAS